MCVVLQYLLCHCSWASAIETTLAVAVIGCKAADSSKKKKSTLLHPRTFVPLLFESLKKTTGKKMIVTVLWLECHQPFNSNQWWCLLSCYRQWWCLWSCYRQWCYLWAVTDSDDICGAATDGDYVCGTTTASEDVCGAVTDSDDVCGAVTDSDDVCGSATDSDVCGAVTGRGDVCGAVTDRGWCLQRLLPYATKSLPLMVLFVLCKKLMYGYYTQLCNEFFTGFGWSFV